MDRSDLDETVRLFDDVLGAVDAGVLYADGAAGAAVVRHMQGAASALRLLTEQAELPDLPDIGLGEERAFLSGGPLDGRWAMLRAGAEFVPASRGSGGMYLRSGEVADSEGGVAGVLFEWRDVAYEQPQAPSNLGRRPQPGQK